MSDGSAGTVVLVHGGFVDGSGWQGVYEQLTKDGYSVSVVQNPTLSLAGDADATRRVIDAQTESVILVGHSYGGAVITEAGTDSNVKALVYIAGFAPDAGESVQTLIADLPPETGPPILPPRTAFSCSIGRSSPWHSQATWTPNWLSSWPTRRSRGPRRRGRHDQRPGMAEQAKLVSRHNR
jgi:pimeloyl-ACP methyl ester carboxylesterase